MAQVRVRWMQRVNGRYPGMEEIVERTDYIDALIAQNRLEVVAPAEHVTAPRGHEGPIVGVFTDEVADFVPGPAELAAVLELPETHGDGSLDDLPVVEKPAPKPRPRARIKPTDPSE